MQVRFLPPQPLAYIFGFLLIFGVIAQNRPFGQMGRFCANKIKKGVCMFLNKIRKKLGLYDLRLEGIKWVRKNIGEKYVDEFIEKYDKVNQGIPIGGNEETVIFLHLIEKIKSET